MKELLVQTYMDCLPQLISILLTASGILLTTKLVPLLRANLTSKQLHTAIQWAEILVDSAQRLEQSGSLETMTKKEYVMEKLLAQIQRSGYTFTQEQLDDIRRAAVVALERLEQTLVA